MKLIFCIEFVRVSQNDNFSLYESGTSFDEILILSGND
jgi:hypothetical protein